MAPRFIGKTSLTGVQPAQLDGQRLLDRHATLQEMLAARLGPAGAALFAEPVPTWPRAETADPGSISWYSDAQGSADPLSGLSSDRRAAGEMRVRDTLQRLQPLLEDAEAGPLLRRALALGSPDGILLIGDTPVLIGWGLVPEGPGSEQDRAARAVAWTRAYMVGDANPGVAAVQPVLAPVAAAGSAALAGRMPAPPGVVPTVPARRGAWDWALVPAGLLTALVFLGLGLWIGIRAVEARIADRPNIVALLDEKATTEAMQRQREQNAALEKEIEARRLLLAGNVCLPDPAQVPRLGPDRAGPVPPATVPPPPGGQPFQGSLADLLTQGVVLVLAPGRDGGLESGSGFFIAPGLIVTNRHVIEDADPAKIVVTSRKLARTTPAQIVAQTPDSEIGSPDIALLRIQDVPGIQPLSLSSTVAPLDQVIAAGFPGLLIQADEAFERLRNGDTSAVPEVILTDGRINAIQPSSGGIKIMPHSAAVSGGNSGGPLVDACGRVVGINTFITSNREQVAHANYAQKADGLIAFLRQNNVAVTDLTAPCVPGGAPAPAAPGAAPAPTPAATPPAPAAPVPAAPAPATPPSAPAPAAPAH